MVLIALDKSTRGHFKYHFTFIYNDCTLKYIIIIRYLKISEENSKRPDLLLFPCNYCQTEVFNITAQHMSHLLVKPTLWFPTRSDTNQAAQSQKQARSLKFQI